MEYQKRKSNIAIFSFSLSIISLLLAPSSIIIMSCLYVGAHDQYGEENIGVVIGFIPAIHLLIVSAVGIFLSLIASIIVLFQKSVFKKHRFSWHVMNP
jgi:hypothetical protein